MESEDEGDDRDDMDDMDDIDDGEQREEVKQNYRISSKTLSNLDEITQSENQIATPTSSRPG